MNLKKREFLVVLALGTVIAAIFIMLNEVYLHDRVPTETVGVADQRIEEASVNMSGDLIVLLLNDGTAQISSETCRVMVVHPENLDTEFPALCMRTGAWARTGLGDSTQPFLSIKFEDQYCVVENTSASCCQINPVRDECTGGIGADANYRVNQVSAIVGNAPDDYVYGSYQLKRLETRAPKPSDNPLGFDLVVWLDIDGRAMVRTVFCVITDTSITKCGWEGQWRHWEKGFRLTSTKDPMVIVFNYNDRFCTIQLHRVYCCLKDKISLTSDPVYQPFCKDADAKAVYQVVGRFNRGTSDFGLRIDLRELKTDLPDGNR